MLGSAHIWLSLEAKFSRRLEGHFLTLSKNSLGNLSQSRKGNEAAGWFTPNGNSQSQIPIFVPIWSQCAKQAQSKLSFSKSFQRRLPKNFAWKPRRFNVPFTSPINPTTVTSNSEPTAGLHLLEDHPGYPWAFPWQARETPCPIEYSKWPKHYKEYRGTVVSVCTWSLLFY